MYIAAVVEVQGCRDELTSSHDLDTQLVEAKRRPEGFEASLWPLNH
jgi:hypothetical protein